MDSAFVAMNFGIAKMDIALVLKEVEMAPHFISRVVCRTIFFVTDWAGEPSATDKVDVNVQFAYCSIEVDFADKQGFFNSQCCFKQLALYVHRDHILSIPL